MAGAIIGGFFRSSIIWIRSSARRRRSSSARRTSHCGGVDLLALTPEPRVKPHHLPCPRIYPQLRPAHVLAVEYPIAAIVGRVVADRIVRDLAALFRPVYRTRPGCHALCHTDG